MARFDDLPDDLRQGLARAQAAQNAPYGSIAQRDNPFQYGSALRRKYGAVFNPPVTTQEDEDDAQIKRNARILTLRQQNAALQDPNFFQDRQSLLRRRQAVQLNPIYPDLGLDDGFGYDD